MKPYEVDGLDLSLVEDFENRNDIKSYLIHKFWHEFAEKAMAFIPNELTDVIFQTNTRTK